MGGTFATRAAVRLLLLALAAGGLWLVTTGPAEAAGETPYDRLPAASPGSQAFVANGSWDRSELTYYFVNGTADIPGDGERDAIRQAFALWQPGTSLSFREVGSASQANIKVQFASIDGPNNVLANAYYPPNGTITIDDDETWTTSTRASAGQPWDLVTIAGHEIGHALGLGHSTDQGALMYQYAGASHRYLAADDRNGIVSLYGPQWNPYGSLDSATQEASSREGARLRGWAADSSTSSSITIHLYVDGTYNTAVLASTYRADVGFRAFDFNVAMSQGVHSACAYGINVGVGTNTLLGCRDVNVRTDPLADVNAVWDYGTGARVRGWAFDFGAPTSALTIQARVDGVLASTFTANTARPDVGGAYPGVGSAHGFDVVVPTSAGAHSVCLTAMNVAGGTNTALACRAVTVTPNPFPTANLRFRPLSTPQRVYDSRVSGAGGKIGPGAIRDVTVRGVGGIATTAKAVAVNVTAITSGATFVTAWPSGTGLPTTSTLNATTAGVVANGAVIGLVNDKVSVFNAQGQTDVIVDVVGTFDDAAPGTGGFHPIQPRRLADTRTNADPLGPGTDRAFDVAGIAGLPASGIEAVVLNVTATDVTAGTYLTIWPGGARPQTSLLNLGPGSTKANNTTVGLGSDGKVHLFNAAGTTHVVVDVVGYWASSATKNLTGVTPFRAYDSRTTGSGLILAPGETRSIQVSGVGGIPGAATARAVAVNITAVPGASSGFLAVYPSDSAMPSTSTLNYAPNSITANGTLIGVGSDGKIKVTNAGGSTHVIVDVTAWTS